ncbi:hypothetical protein ASE70_12815 [Sphingomonas sp. Leaf22]|uniref:hypothetical protein n=1 Tax=Sphingomonas sp. Leaf22 TaxID=1735687 RepID=UPI0006FF67A7|nr:hypothetical protein [Sphingomonas sp. Leaf22]KQM93927.1 hypothetical protein ASE70_12815 [Sphingomonas sp. Leaf22]
MSSFIMSGSRLREKAQPRVTDAEVVDCSGEATCATGSDDAQDLRHVAHPLVPGELEQQFGGIELADHVRPDGRPHVAPRLPVPPPDSDSPAKIEPVPMSTIG